MRKHTRLQIILSALCRGRAIAHEMARACGASVRTIYRDVAKLRAEGYKIGSSAGRAGGFWLLPDSKPAPLAMTADEIRELVLTATAAARRGELPSALDGQKAVATLLAALPRQASRALETLMTKLYIQPVPAQAAHGQARPINPDVLSGLALALDQQRLLWACGDVFEPEGILLDHGVYSLLGWDRHRRVHRAIPLHEIPHASVRNTRFSMRRRCVGNEPSACI